MRALVTGGCGFIGSNVVKTLLAKNVQVKVLDNLSTGYAKNIRGLDVEFVRGDIRQADVVRRALRRVDVVFHLAASVGNQRSLKDSRADSEVNALGTLNIMEASRKSGVERVIYSSSAAIFGELLTSTVTEDHPQNPETPYGVSKLAGENYVMAFGKLYGIISIALRYFNVYGINQRYDPYGNVIPVFAKRLQQRKALIIHGDGRQTRDFINVRDVANANYLAATIAPESSVFNVGTGKTITINSLAKTLLACTGLSASLVPGPKRIGDVRHCRADITRIERALGFKPDTDIRKGLSQYYEWFSRERQQ